LKGKTNRTTLECSVTSDLPESHEKNNRSEPKEDSTEQPVTSQDNTHTNQSVIDNINQSESSKLEKDSSDTNQTDTDQTDGEEQEGEITVTADMLEDVEEDEGIEEDEEDDEDDDDDGWITPSNITTLKQKMAGHDHEKAAVDVGCLTTDFAMQVQLYYVLENKITANNLNVLQAVQSPLTTQNSIRSEQN
jgi:RNA-binding protein NOB1